VAGIGKTISEKVLSRASGKPDASAGEIVLAEVDLLMLHEITGPLAIRAFEEMGFERVWDPSKVVVAFDHNVPPSDISSAAMMREMRSFVRAKGLENFFEIGRGGIAHQLLAEGGMSAPGKLIVGADSHTCTAGGLGAFGVGVGSTEAAAVLGTGKLWFRIPETFRVIVRNELIEPSSPKDLILEIIGEIGMDGAIYKAIEYCGEGIRSMSVDGRLTLANMSIEMSAKTGIVEPDERVASYIRERTGRSVEPIRSDDDAEFEESFEFDASETEPLVAVPPRIDDVKPARELGGIEIDQAFLGSCTNGRLEDLRAAARVLGSKKVDPRVRMVVTPASMEIYREAMREGLLDAFARAGAIVCCPSCGPCLGMSQGVLGPEEVCISSTNRNFVGRMGHRSSRVFLASPATVAASAIAGRITDPRDVG
jgi:3-isopropylmalate/(R)-2-methylmalate dehydratase large subunit